MHLLSVSILLIFHLEPSSGLLSVSHLTCQRLLEDWAWRLSPQLDPELARLSVDWRGLDRDLERAGCAYDRLWLELWRVS